MLHYPAIYTKTPRSTDPLPANPLIHFLRQAKPFVKSVHVAEHGLLLKHIGTLGESVYLEWVVVAKVLEFSHYLFKGGLTLAEFQAGRPIS
jgi:hypothetical protein